MAIAWQTETNNLLVYRVSGKLGLEEMNQAVQESAPLLVGNKSWKVLVVLRDFAGWSKEDGWETSTPVDETGEHVSRMALAGPLEWRGQVEMFTLKGMRPLEIEYFTGEDDARVWLAE